MNAEEIRKELEGQKRPFIEPAECSKPQVKIYSVQGDYFIFDDYSGIVPLNGNVEEVREAVQNGTIDGKVRTFEFRQYATPMLDDEWQSISCIFLVGAPTYGQQKYSVQEKDNGGHIKSVDYTEVREI